MTRTLSRLRTEPWAQLAAAMLLVAVVTYASVRVSLDFFKVPGTASAMWWPLTGIVLVIVVRCPRRWQWPLLAVFALVNAVANLPLGGASVVLTYAAVNVIEVAVAAAVLRGTARTHTRRLRTPQEAARFAIAIVVAVAAGAAIIAARALIVPGDFPWHAVTLGYVTSHILGMLSLAPLLLPGSAWWLTGLKRHVEFVLVVAGAVVINWWIFLQPLASGRAFPVLIPVIWAAIRLDPLRATAVSLFTSAMAAYGTSRDRGTFVGLGELEQRPLVTQILIGTIAITTLALVLITRHRALLGAQARDSEQTLKIAIREALVGIYSVRLDAGHVGEIIDVNIALAQMLGYAPEDLVGRRDTIFRVPADLSETSALEGRFQQLASGAIDAFQRETRFAMSTGDDLWVELSATRLNPTTGTPFALIYVHDLTGREHTKKMLESMALHDALTGLANRAVLFPRLDDVLGRARRNGALVGLLYLDLDGFKPVNDTHGHAAGDTVLVEVARRLESAVRPGDTVARLGGDEFAVLAADIVECGDLTAIEDRIRGELARPIILPNGAAVTISGSIGAAVGSGDTTADQLVRAADAAMYRVKDAGRAIREDVPGVAWRVSR